MKTMIHYVFIFFSMLAIASLSLASCGTLEVTVDQTATPDLRPQATAQALATQNAQLITQIATLDPIHLPLDMSASSESIRMKVLRSYIFWNTIFADGIVTSYAPDGQSVQSLREQLWVSQSMLAFRRVAGPVDGAAELFSVSDGQSILSMDLKTGQTDTTSFPPFAKDAYNPPATVTDTVYPHPLIGQIGSRISEMLLPSGLGQRTGTFQPVGMEKIAGRTALIADWYWPDGSRPSRYWMDVETGIILKEQDFGKGGGETVQQEVEITDIAYDPEIPSALFSLVLDLVPGFSDVTGAPLAAVTPGPTVAPGSDPLGELYFDVIDGETIKLMRLPGSCIVGLTACPEMEEIAFPTSAKIYTEGLVWSPDGTRAAIGYPLDDSGLGYKLYLFDPLTKSWTALAEFPIIDIPMWSQNGRWIGFRVQDGQGEVEYYAIHPDGTGLINLTASNSLPQDGLQMIMETWIGSNALLRSERGDGTSMVYSVRADDGLVRPLFDTPVTKSIFTGSPDGSLLAFLEFDNTLNKITLRIIAPDGSGLRDLATFSNTSIAPLVWSPDGEKVAFVAYTSSFGGNVTSEVYLINRDGRGFQRVYIAETIGGLSFSPDGKYLAIMSTTPEQISISNLDTLEIRLLQAPGLSPSLRTRWPAWR